MELRKVMSGDCDRVGIKVLVVDDHDRFRTGLAGILADQGFVVDAAAGTAAALERALQFGPDVVLMDVDMPGVSGVQATRRLLQAMPTVRVVMLGYHEEGLLEAIRAGACGYLGKEARLGEIVAAIDAAALGEFAVSPRVSGTLAAHLRASSGSDDGVAPPAPRRLEPNAAAAIDLDRFRPHVAPAARVA